MECINCLRQDREIRGDDHIVAEFNGLSPFDEGEFNNWTGGIWHAECAKVHMSLS